MIDALAALAPWLIVGAVCLLVGCAMGYYTAATDLAEHERKAAQRAWAEGHAAGSEDQFALDRMTPMDLETGPVPPVTPNPYSPAVPVGQERA